MYNNKPSTVTGWGYTSNRHIINSDEEGDEATVLMGVNVTTIENEECQKHHEGDIFDNNICAKGEKGKDNCDGDSGGDQVGFYACRLLDIGNMVYSS